MGDICTRSFVVVDAPLSCFCLELFPFMSARREGLVAFFCFLVAASDGVVCRVRGLFSRSFFDSVAGDPSLSLLQNSLQNLVFQLIPSFQIYEEF